MWVSCTSASDFILLTEPGPPPQAMHLIYKVLENNPVPSSVPQEMLSSAQRAGVAQGPVPAPLAPPSQVPQPNTPKQQQNKVVVVGCRPECAVVGIAEQLPSLVLVLSAVPR